MPMAQPQLLWEFLTNNIPLAITAGPGQTAGWRCMETVLLKMPALPRQLTSLPRSKPPVGEGSTEGSKLQQGDPSFCSVHDFKGNKKKKISIDLKSRLLIHSVPRTAKEKEHGKGAPGVGPYPVPGLL